MAPARDRRPAARFDIPAEGINSSGRVSLEDAVFLERDPEFHAKRRDAPVLHPCSRLKRREERERRDRRHPVDVRLAELLEDELLGPREEKELALACALAAPARDHRRAADVELLLLEIREHFARSRRHGGGQPRELGDLDTVAAVGGAGTTLRRNTTRPPTSLTAIVAFATAVLPSAISVSSW